MSDNSKDTILQSIQRILEESPSRIQDSATGYDRQPRTDLAGTAAVLQCFAEMLVKVGGEAHLLDGEEAAVSVLRSLLGELNGQTILLPLDPEIERMGLSRLAAEAGVKVLHPGEVPVDQTASAALGVTTAQAGIADTGTVVLLHTAERGRLAALLAPVHVVFLRKELIYPDKITFLSEARRLKLNLGGVSLTWVTGPSLTADIEKVLVRGAHGPRRVVVLVY